MFSFQAIHNRRSRESTGPPLFIDYVNVLFSSNSQLDSIEDIEFAGCLSIMSMFSFQAIHNFGLLYLDRRLVVYRLCQCSLFKQFTTWLGSCCDICRLFIDYVNVLFSSNSQLIRPLKSHVLVVYRLCQCSLFKQFTTLSQTAGEIRGLFIDYVNVLFSSNSQHTLILILMIYGCLSIMSMFSFQAIHNPSIWLAWRDAVVYRLCQCSLFKQFTTPRQPYSE